MLELQINGRMEDLNVQTLDQVIEHYELKPEHVVAEVDGVIVEREQWPSFGLVAGMKIELVHFVGGG